MADMADICVMCGRFRADAISCDLDDGMGCVTTCADCLDMITNDPTQPKSVRALALDALNLVRPL